jgi:hypothetical protein
VAKALCYQGRSVCVLCVCVCVQYIVAKALCYQPCVIRQPWCGNILWPKKALLAEKAWLGFFCYFFGLNTFLEQCCRQCIP